jgi:predicted CxxxxCH...CXXCH cytochrome family protein
MATDAAATGSHVKHANPTLGMNVPCGYCHQDGGDGTNIHADNQIFINFTSYIGGTYSVGTPYLTGTQKVAQSAAFGTCATTFCHGTADSPAWGTAGPLACNDCHSAKVDDVSWSGAHKIHYNYSTMPTNYTQTVQDLSSTNKYRFNCAHCHDDNVSKHSLKPATADAAARVFFGISSATPASSSRRGTYTYGAAQGATDNGFKFTSGVCNASYCHSNGRGGAPFDSSLTWTTAKSAGTNCTKCHDTKKTGATATTLSGKHDKHMNPTNNAMIGAGNGFGCVDCHAPTVARFSNLSVTNKGKHVNAILNYSGARALKRNYVAGSGSCSTYCHSNGNTGAVVFVSMTGSKVWTGAGTITTCNKCHGRSNSYGYPDYANGGSNNATSNLHTGHMQGMTSTTACADCHRKTAETAVPNRFRPYSTMHLSGAPNVAFDRTKAYVGPNATANTVGYQVTCSNMVCHGQAAPVWGAQKAGSGGAGVRTCTKCHGTTTTADYLTNYSSAMIAPGYNNEGTDTSQVNAAPTSPRVGAHQRHMLGNAISSPVKCGDCHVVVTSVRSGNHWNYSTATLTFNGKAIANGHTPSVTRTNGIISCSTTNCHTGKWNSGTVPAPFWNMTGLVKESAATVAACNKCHAMPPSGFGSHPAALSDSAPLSSIYGGGGAGTCYSCHQNINPAVTNVSNAFTDKTIHVNGVINYNMACNSCHDYDTNGGTWGLVNNKNYGGTAAVEGRGAHYKHIEYLKTRYAITLNATSDTYGGANMTAVCGACHSISSGDHSMDQAVNTRTINFGGSTARQFGGSAPNYNGNSTNSSSVNPKSCSNIDCHYKTSPIWSTY